MLLSRQVHVDGRCAGFMWEICRLGASAAAGGHRSGDGDAQTGEATEAAAAAGPSSSGAASEAAATAGDAAPAATAPALKVQLSKEEEALFLDDEDDGDEDDDLDEDELDQLEEQLGRAAVVA
jgi:hypothetical protein